MQDLARARLELVAAEPPVVALHLAEAREQSIHLRRALRVGERVLELRQLRVQLAELAAPRDRLVEHAGLARLARLLPEVPDAQVLRHRDLARVGPVLADDQAEERRLPRAVRADQPDAIAGVELERGVDEQGPPAVVLGDSAERDHEPCTVPDEGERT